MRVSALVGTVLVAMLPAAASFSLGVAPASRRFVAASQSQPAAALRVPAMPMMVEAKEEKGEEKENMMQQVKDAGVAGIISYIFWEWAFWGVSIPVCIFGYREVRQHTDRAWLGRGCGVRASGWAEAQTQLRHRRRSALISTHTYRLGRR